MNKFNVGDRVEKKGSNKIGYVIEVLHRREVGLWFYTVKWSDGKITIPKQSQLVLYQNRYTARG